MEPTFEAPQKHFVNRVTPFSKGLALVLFVVFPVVALWVGYAVGANSTHSSNYQDDSSISTSVNLADDEPEATHGYKTFTSVESGISFLIPEDWNTMSSPSVYFPKPIVSSPTYEFINGLEAGDPGVHLGSSISLECEQNPNFSKYDDSYIAFVESSKRAYVLKESRITLDGKPALLVQTKVPQSLERAKTVDSIYLYVSGEPGVCDIVITSAELTETELYEVTNHLIRNFKFI